MSPNQLPTEEDRGSTGAPREISRRARSLLKDLSLGAFLRRVTHLMDFTHDEPPSPAKGVKPDLVKDWCAEALDKQGNMAGLLAIARVADAYRSMTAPERDVFFAMLLNDFASDAARLKAALNTATQALAAQTPHGRADAGPNEGNDGRADGGADRVTDASADGAPVSGGKAMMALAQATLGPRWSLFQQFNTIPEGVKFLVDMRADLLERVKDAPQLEILAFELRTLLEVFFNLGFLHLERITWKSPAALLERLVAYEAVHRIANWQDLKHRLISDRACFAFLHPNMPLEPLIFVEVALVRGMADNIQHLLDLEGPDLRPEQADTAIFYSISNAQKGLRGIPFGNLLIKQVASRLKGEAPNLKYFATLSPIPGLRGRFLDKQLESGSIQQYYKDGEARKVMEQLASLPDIPRDDLNHAIQAILHLPDWQGNAPLADALKPGLLRAARAYLTEEIRDGHVACPVGHFHGSNGALLARINWLGDTSENGLSQSAGIMVNYQYDLEAFDRHQADYTRTGKLPVAKAVKEL